MSRNSVRQKREAAAADEFIHWTQRLQFELAMRTPRRHLDSIVRVLELCIERAGDSLLVQEMKRQLAELKATVATRHNLRSVAKCGPRPEGDAA